MGGRPAGAFNGGIKADSKVMEPPFKDTPATLKEFLDFLSETHKKVRVELIMHGTPAMSGGVWEVPLNRAS